MDCSDFVNEIKCFNKNKLIRVVTRITEEGGKIVEETHENGTYQRKLCGTCHGYVVDYKPDLQVAAIIPRLLLASQDVAQDLDLLKSNNVTHILNLAYGQPNFHQSEFIYRRLDIRDDPQENIKVFFEECFNFIINGMKEGSVLVHCNAGVSRSATVVIAYLMYAHKKSLSEAFNIVKSARPLIRPNDGFMKQLQEYEQYLCNK